jgi:hypothetical protein
MWFIADAWARSSGAHGSVQHRGGDYFPTDNEIGLALIVGAILIWIAWLMFEFFKLYGWKRGRPMARAMGRAASVSQLDGRRLNDRVRSVKIEDE